MKLFTATINVKQWAITQCSDEKPNCLLILLSVKYTTKRAGNYRILMLGSL